MGFLKRRRENPLKEPGTHDIEREDKDDAACQQRARQEKTKTLPIESRFWTEYEANAEGKSPRSPNHVNVESSKSHGSKCPAAQSHLGLINNQTTTQSLATGVPAVGPDLRTTPSNSDRPITWSQSRNGETVPTPFLRPLTAISVGRLNRPSCAGAAQRDSGSRINDSTSNGFPRLGSKSSASSKVPNRVISHTQNPEDKELLFGNHANGLAATASSGLVDVLEGCDQVFDAVKAFTNGASLTGNLLRQETRPELASIRQNFQPEPDERSWLQPPGPVYDHLERPLFQHIWETEARFPPRYDYPTPSSQRGVGSDGVYTATAERPQHLICDPCYTTEGHVEDFDCRSPMGDYYVRDTTEQYGAAHRHDAGHHRYPCRSPVDGHDEYPQDVRSRSRSICRPYASYFPTGYSGSRPADGPHTCNAHEAWDADLEAAPSSTRYPAYASGGADWHECENVAEYANVDVLDDQPVEEEDEDESKPRRFWRRQKLY